MKLQMATRCGLYAVLELVRSHERHLSAADIAGKYDISLNHLAKVLRILGRAGLVESVRGAGGGYRFVGNPRRVTLYDVITLFEDVGTNLVDRAQPGDDTDMGRGLRAVLAEIDEIALATLRSVTLETLLALARRLDRSPRRQRPSSTAAAD